MISELKKNLFFYFRCYYDRVLCCFIFSKYITFINVASFLLYYNYLLKLMCSCLNVYIYDFTMINYVVIFDFVEYLYR